jgi:hypothetical protein
VKTLDQEAARLAYLKGRQFDPFEEAVIETQPSGFASRPDLGMTPATIVLKTDTELKTEVEALSDAVFVFRNVYYPSWKVRVDGNMERPIAVNHAFTGVFLKKGSHQVQFFFDLGLQKMLEALSMMTGLGLLFMNVFLWRVKRER